MNQSSLALAIALLVWVLLKPPARHLMVALSAFISMPFVYMGFTVGLPFLLSLLGFRRLLRRHRLPQATLLLFIALAGTSAVGMTITDNLPDLAAVARENLLLVFGFLFLVEIDRRLIWEHVTARNLRRIIFSLGALSLFQILLSRVAPLWGSVDGQGANFFPTNHLFGLEILRPNVFGYEPKIFGAAMSMLLAMYFARVRIERGTASSFVIIIALFCALLSGSKSALLSSAAVLVIFAAQSRTLWQLSISGTIIGLGLFIIAESDSNELRALSAFDIFYVQDLEELGFGADKDVPALLALKDRPEILIAGSGFGLGSQIYSSYGVLTGKDGQLGDVNFGLIGLAYDFGIIGFLCMIMFLFRSLSRDALTTFSIMVTALLTYNIFILLTALVAARRITSATRDTSKPVATQVIGLEG